MTRRAGGPPPACRGGPGSGLVSDRNREGRPSNSTVLVLSNYCQRRSAFALRLASCLQVEAGRPCVGGIVKVISQFRARSGTAVTAITSRPLDGSIIIEL